MATGAQPIDTSDGSTLLKAGKVEQAQLVDGEQRVDLDAHHGFTTDGVDYGKRVQFYYIAPQGPHVVAAITEADPPKGYNSRVPRQRLGTLFGLFLPLLLLLGAVLVPDVATCRAAARGS